MATASSTASICRRLFGESVPRAIVQKTLENVVKKDQERFSTRWNFDMFRTGLTEDINKLQTTAPSLTIVNSRFDKVNRMDPIKWKLIQPDAVFYSTPPRKLKARRRISPSVAEKLHQNTQLAESSLSQTKENTNEIFNVSQDINSVPQSISENTISSPVSNKLRRSIIIRPQEEDEESSFQILQFNNFSITEKPALNTFRKVKRSRLSEQPTKRCLDSRVTDYFVVNKRARESLK